MAIREEVLDRLSFDEDPRLRSARARRLTREAADELAERTPGLALEAGIGQVVSAIRERTVCLPR